MNEEEYLWLLLTWSSFREKDHSKIFLQVYL